MKNVKKFLALIVALMILAASMSVAMAANDGTITVTNATKGITYQAYKLFDATLGSGGAVSYTVPAAKKDSVSAELFNISNVADSNGNYTISKKASVTDDAVLTWVKANYSTFAGDAITGAWDATGSTYTFSNLPYGYYYITSSLGSVVTIDTTVPNAEVKDKNDSTPDGPDKEITKEDAVIAGSDEAFSPYVKTNDAAVGTTESFEVTFDAVNWITSTAADGTVTTNQARVWKFKDTPTGLDIDVSTVKVFVTNNGTEQEITSTITDKAKSAEGVLTFNIPWVDANNNNLYQPKVATGTEVQTAKIPVRVTYDAKILPAAATAVAPNTVEIKYTNDNNQDVVVGDDHTDTYTYKFKLDKAKADYTDLIGAKFELYLGSVADGNKVHFTVDGTTYTVTDDATGVTEIDLTSSATATILGLDKKSYVLRETVVPAGYNQAEDQTVADTVLKRVDEAITDAAGTITGDDGVVTVVNNQGAELPSTGGIGTTIFYVAGGILVLAAVILLVTKRRMNAND